MSCQIAGVRDRGTAVPAYAARTEVNSTVAVSMLV